MENSPFQSSRDEVVDALNLFSLAADYLQSTFTRTLTREARRAHGEAVFAISMAADDDTFSVHVELADGSVYAHEDPNSQLVIIGGLYFSVFGSGKFRFEVDQEGSPVHV